MGNIRKKKIKISLLLELLTEYVYISNYQHNNYKVTI